MALVLFAERFNELLNLEGLTGYALSQLEDDIELKSIHNWQRGVYYPSPYALLKLADRFKVSTDYLLGLDDYGEQINFEVYLSKGDMQRSVINKLYKYKEQEGISFYRLAKRIGVGQSTLTRWFKSGSMPETVKLIRITVLLKIPMDELLGRK